MFNLEKLIKLEDYFKACPERLSGGVYFCRMVSYSEDHAAFLIRFFDEARRSGVYIKGRIQNPNEQQLDFYEEAVGLDFSIDKEFQLRTMKLWLPRLMEEQRQNLCEALSLILNEMKAAGKNDAILKNSYIKFMCWFYYKFERVLVLTGKTAPPKVLYEGTVSDYELKLMRILSRVGCDILLVQPEGDSGYLKVDPSSKYSQSLEPELGASFPDNFSIPDLKQTISPLISHPKGEQIKVGVPKRELGARFHVEPAGVMSTNTWLSGDVFADSLKTEKERGSDEKQYYNIFTKVVGAEEPKEYDNLLLRWKMKLENSGRKIVLIQKRIPVPDVEEVAKLKLRPATDISQVIADILANISFPKCTELEKLVKKAFLDLILEKNETMQAVKNKAVYMGCWINRYIPMLFADWGIGTNPVFICFDGGQDEKEAMFLRLLSKVPVDVILFHPDLQKTSKLQDDRLFEKVYSQSVTIDKFPTSVEEVSFQTAAFHAEQDLNTLMYQDTGLYRNQQFKRAMAVTVSTIYEEIDILWDQEAKYRPHFETLDDRVIVPVIFSKISGVKDGDKTKYWETIARQITADTFVIRSCPHLGGQMENPVSSHAVSFLKNGKLLIDKIKSHPTYQYGFMRADMQDYMLDKLQVLLDSKSIEGTFTNGTEYTIIATALNLEKEILRLIQRYDFTKKIPKLIMIHTTESVCSLEDSILTAYLNMLGFDILLYAPTGYQCVERYFSHPLFIEHQAGEYMYDLRVPDLHRMSGIANKGNLIGKLFKKGR